VQAGPPLLGTGARRRPRAHPITPRSLVPLVVHRDGNPLLTDEGFLNPWCGIRRMQDKKARVPCALLLEKGSRDARRDRPAGANMDSHS